MKCAFVSSDRCKGHERCEARKACPTKALVQLDRGESAVVDASNCRGCGDCVSACPSRAISIRQV